MTRIGIVLAVLSLLALLPLAAFARAAGPARIVLAALACGVMALVLGPVIKLAIGDVLEIVPLGSNLAALVIAVLLAIAALR